MKLRHISVFILLLYLPNPSQQSLSDEVESILASIKTDFGPYSPGVFSEDAVTSEFVLFGKRIAPFTDIYFKNEEAHETAKEFKAALEDLMQGMIAKMDETYMNMNSLPSGLKFPGTTYSNVEFDLKVMLFQTEMSTIIKSAANFFTGLCYRENSVLAQRFVDFAHDCANKTLNAEANAIITDLLGQFYYSKDKMSEVDEFWFRRSYFTLYHYLNAKKDLYRKKINEFVSDQTKYVKNKGVLLKMVVEALELDPKYVSTSCLPLNLFVYAQYDREAVENFITTIRNHFKILQYITSFCTRLLVPDSPPGEGGYIRMLQEQLPIVARWTSSWANSLLESTWPKIEKDLVASYMNERSRGYPIEEDTNEYKEIVYFVKMKMWDVGHPNYRRGYILHSYDSPPLRTRSYHICDMNSTKACAVATSNDAQCLITRTDVSNGTLKGKLRRLTQFKKKTEPTLQKAMDSKYWKVGPLRIILERLRDVEGIDFSNFTDHSSLAVVRSSSYFTRCFNIYAVETEYEQGVPYIQTIQYHNKGNWLTSCHLFTFFLGV